MEIKTEKKKNKEKEHYLRLGRIPPASAHLSPKPISCTPSTSTRGPQVSQLAPAYNLPQPLTRGTHLSGFSPSSLGLELEPRMTAYRGSRGALQPPRSMTGGTYTESETALATTVNQDAPRPPLSADLSSANPSL